MTVFTTFKPLSTIMSYDTLGWLLHPKYRTDLLINQEYDQESVIPFKRY